MSTWFAKIDANLDENPKVEAAGFWAARVYELLLRLNRKHNFDGVVPLPYVTPRYIVRRLQLDQAVGLKDSPEDLIAFALNEAVSAGLIEGTGDGWRILGWDDDWRGPKSAKERVADHRSRKRSETTGNEVKRPVTQSNGVTPPRVEESRVEKSRVEENIPIPASGGAVAPVDTPLPNSQSPTAKATEAVIAAFNNCFGRSLGSKGYREGVARVLRQGYTEAQIRGVIWWASHEWGEDEDMRKRITPTTLLKLHSSQGYRTFPQYLECAGELWRDQNQGEDPPWE